MEREVSLPFAPPSPAPARRPVERAEGSALRLDVASVLEQRADDIAARWWDEARALLPAATISTVEGSPGSPAARHAWGATLVRSLAAALASGDDADAATMSRVGALGAAAFQEGVPLHHLLRAVDRLVARLLDVVEDAVTGADARIEAADAMHVCRALLVVTETMRLATARGFAEAGDQALRERFRRLRHDLRNPIGTIRSALSLMADETVPEEARHGPRFRAMIERNTAALDQLIVARLSDGEAQLQPTAAAAPAAAPASAAPGVGEARDDLAGARERDDRQPGSL
jgi:signal transduction histidine kinase